MDTAGLEFLWTANWNTEFANRHDQVLNNLSLQYAIWKPGRAPLDFETSP